MPQRNGHHTPDAASTTLPAGKETRLIVLASVIAITIFAIDLAIPLGIALPMSYVALVLIALWSDQKWVTVTFAGGGMLLTVIGFLFSSSGSSSLGLINRGLAILVIAACAYLILRTQHARQELHTLHRFLSMCASCRRIKDEHGGWSGLEQYIEQRMDLLFSHSMCPLCVEKWYPDLYPELQLRYPELFQSQPN